MIAIEFIREVIKNDDQGNGINIGYSESHHSFL